MLSRIAAKKKNIWQLFLVTVAHRIKLQHNVSFYFPNITIDNTKVSTSVVEAQQEAASLKAEKEKRCELRQKKAQQKTNQEAGLATDSDDEFEARPNPDVRFFLLLRIK
jgi:hypothetical protein